MPSTRFRTRLIVRRARTPLRRTKDTPSTVSGEACRMSPRRTAKARHLGFDLCRSLGRLRAAQAGATMPPQ